MLHMLHLYIHKNNLGYVSWTRTIVSQYDTWVVTWSFLPYVLIRLIDIARYIIYNRVLTTDYCQNFVNLSPALRY